ncbi:putative lactoylglutathione lyase [Nocardia mexicana]|uniref:Putative lactoylglutathione lyase n=1 Tax=Nocardia mexicana TaxID=279262 RepID=A0A370GN01_9NOCA|nr:putative lactoylglutathione lyase [Nocardia mexicana]
MVVSDMAAALAFYRRLGLEFGEDFGGHVEAELPGGFRLTLDSEANIHSFHPDFPKQLNGKTGRIGLAFRCESAAEVDSMFEDLVGAGYHGELKPFDAFWGQRYASVQDPDGNGVDLYAPLD